MNKYLPFLLGISSYIPISGQEHPNVLLILTDDQGWGDVGAHGNSLIHTPTLDKLYNESAVLNHFYVCPLSAPTRASLLTGRYHLNTGVSSVSGGLENMNPEETTIAEIFKATGYHTGCFGKWHSGSYYPYTPNGQGFDEFLGFCCGHWANYFDPALQHNEVMMRGKGYISDIFADSAIHFIEQNRDKPFFCYLAFNAPHSPFQVPDQYFDRYRDLKAAKPNDRDMLACIYGMVENVDFNISRVLAKLEQLHLLENTIVLFMTDNGPAHVKRYNGDMTGMKGQVYEGGVRVPCYVSWKGKIKHHIIDEPTAHIDILPTVLDLCNIKDYTTAFPIDGINVKSLLYDTSDRLPDRYIFTHKLEKTLSPHLGSVRTREYRLSVYKDSVALFHLEDDPQEKNNLYQKEPDVAGRMLTAYTEWYQKASKHVHPSSVVPVGYDVAPVVRIPTPEGKMYGQLKCYGAPNQNWVNHFQNSRDSLVIKLDVVQDGAFDVSVAYTQSEPEAQPTVVVECGSQTVSAKLPPFLTSQIYSPDRVKRGEAYEQTWASQPVGTVRLKKGKYFLKVYVENAPSAKTVQIKTVLLNKVKS
jgi:arylsulfatase A